MKKKNLNVALCQRPTSSGPLEKQERKAFDIGENLINWKVGLLNRYNKTRCQANP